MKAILLVGLVGLRALRGAGTFLDRGRWIIAVSVCAIALFGFGCGFIRSLFPGGVDPKTLDEGGMTPEEVARKSAQADRLFEPPRTPDRVEASYKAAFDSRSKANGWRGLWQAARAAEWLAENLPDKKRAEDYARDGIVAGREAARLAPNAVESWYFLALCYGRLSDLLQTPRFVGDMAEAGERARAIDERYDRAGPDRFLGLLNLNTEGKVFVGYGDFDKAMELLRRAVELSPDAENRVALAQALVKDEQYPEARQQLDAALAAKAPPGMETEQEGWLRQARELLEKIKE